MAASASSSALLVSSFLSSFPDVLERVPVMSWMTNAAGETTFTNRQWLSFVGSTLANQCGSGWADGLHPEDRASCVRAYRDAHEARIPFSGEYRWRRSDGVYRLLQTSGVPLYDPAGEFQGYVGLCTDVTDERGAAHALAQTSDQLRFVASNADEMIYRLRLLPRPALEYVSPGSLRITGYAPEDFIANNRIGLTLVVDEDRPIVQQLLANPLAAPPVVTLRWRHPDGRIVWAQHTRVPVRDASGAVVAIEGVARDITRQKELERERNEHAALLTSLIANMNEGVLVESDSGRVLLTNQAFCTLFALSREPSGLADADATALTAQLAPWRARRRTIKARGRQCVGEEITLADGRILELQYAPVRRDDDTIAHLWQFRDISSRKQFEAELHASRQRLRELAAHIDAIRDEERRAAARTLHDELGQLLTAVKLELSAATDVFRSHPGEHAFKAIDRMQSAVGLLDVCIQTVQRVSAQLRPEPVPEMRISEALRYEARLFEQRTKIRCRVSVVPAKLQVDAVRSAVLYRILLESLTNVARHADAGSVHISLTQRSGVVFLSVRDNGRGIAPEEIDNPVTMGLLGMRERALSVGGDVRITHGARGGTTITAILPLPPDRPRHVAAGGPAHR